MIDQIRIDGYKCLRAVDLSLGSLNVFSGPNSSGKSSVLQTLLLLRQSADSFGVVRSLRLSGDLYEAGTAEDILHPGAEHKINIGFAWAGNVTNLKFNYDRNTESSVQPRLLHALHEGLVPTSLAGETNEFAYLNAERRGPRLTYPLPPEDQQLLGVVGKYGEFTPAILARAATGIYVDQWSTEFANILANGPRLLDHYDLCQELLDSNGRLDTVCNIFFNWIIPGASFQVAEHDQTDHASLRFGRQILSATSSSRTTHSGFGLTYTLPIIAACLSVKQGGMLIIENPEAHLPPFSQSRIGVFLAMMAATGRQVFVETHSDHVVNGIRLAINQGLIQHSDVFFNFFNKPRGSDSSEIVTIKPLPNGRLDKWPEGFFDQIESDLSRL